ncbi:unnamed protein product [Nyctereutes procyonoides]|uniref:(raccoon dog) hypothetical protein n=1 Tax=Nyctereutes procyonoides TaxID=34880 RepID=A0A811Z7A9_NYCPR|nr:unnamed protein product [Nyctereutes procyonoides]
MIPGVTVKDMSQQEFVRALEPLSKLDTVKLAKHKELAPYNENWLYTRAASTARHLYLWGGAGGDAAGSERYYGSCNSNLNQAKKKRH